MQPAWWRKWLRLGCSFGKVSATHTHLLLLLSCLSLSMTIAYLLLDKLKLYSSSTIPALLFYILTCKQPRDTASNAILSAIVLLNFVVPITHNGAHGDMIDHSVVATLTSYLGFGMVRYMVDRHQGKPTVPFYRVLDMWNQRPPSQQQSTEEKTTSSSTQQPLDTSTMQSNTFKWLMLAMFRVLLSMPVMAFLDGFLRVCNEPPLDPSYISLMLSGQWIPIPTLYYHAIASIALIMHLVLVPTVWLVIHSSKLSYFALFSPKTMASYHDKVAEFVQRPPLFDRLWLASSVHDMWSRYANVLAEPSKQCPGWPYHTIDAGTRYSDQHFETLPTSQ